jgi:hypothetical protein
MTDADLPAFRAILSELGSVYQRKLDEDVIRAYRKALQDLELAQVQLGADRCARTRRYFPRPAEIREAVGEARQESSGRQASRDPGAPTCPECQGNGWMESWCSGRGECGLPSCKALGYAHGLASRCPRCRPPYRRPA